MSCWCKATGPRSIACGCAWAGAPPTPSTITSMPGGRSSALACGICPAENFRSCPSGSPMSCNSWNEALDSAHETLQGTLAEREHALSQREQALDAATRHLAEREQPTAARAQALEESLSLAREQLCAGNRRADSLEATLQERDTECGRLRSRLEAQEAMAADLRASLDSTAAAHQAERAKLEERYEAAETRWLTEVDQARQLVKETAQE